MKKTDREGEKQAIADYRKMSYDIAKIVARLSDIYDRMQFIDQQRGWDGMHEIDFEKALALLGRVQAATVTYSLEPEYVKDDIEYFKQSLAAYEHAETSS